MGARLHVRPGTIRWPRGLGRCGTTAKRVVVPGEGAWATDGNDDGPATVLRDWQSACGDGGWSGCLSTGFAREHARDPAGTSGQRYRQVDTTTTGQGDDDRLGLITSRQAR